MIGLGGSVMLDGRKIAHDNAANLPLVFFAKFPKWMVFAPGVSPILADAATYIGIVLVGHSVMSLIAGPPTRDHLARRA